MRIVITGMGIVSAIGKDVPETLCSLREERSGISPVVFQGIGSQMVGSVKVSNETLSHELMIDGEVPRSVLLGVKAAREALLMAGIDNREEMTFVNGTTVGGMDVTEQHFPKMTEEIRDMHLADTCSRLIAKGIGIRGEVITISTACSSALNSMIKASNMLRTGVAKRVLAGGTECLTLFHQQGFMSLGIVGREMCRPFDATRNGLNLGEGAAYIVLEAEEKAKRRGASVLGYIAGYGNACDAYHQTATSDDGEGAFRAMSEALSMAQIMPGAIDYINAHGTSTVNNDMSESAAIVRVFGQQHPLVSSTKPFTGHTTSASGAIETVISVVAMREGFVPSNLNWTKGDGSTVEPVSHTICRPLNYVMCNSFGFGGNDSSLILSARPVELPAIHTKESTIVGTAEKREGDDYSHWLKAIEARRMTEQTKLVVAAACEALENAGISRPDAIITTTRLGLIENSKKILEAMGNGEDVKPSLFMLSTHNSISSLLAIKFGCRGYNSTYCSETGAEEDAEMLIATGRAKSVMLVEYEENEEIWRYTAKAKVRIVQ